MIDLNVSFQTLQLPPPYAYAYTLDIASKKGGLFVQFAKEYLNRESLDVEEILNEGFTENDDLQWEGELPEIWKTPLSNLMEDTVPSEVSENENSYLFLSSKSHNFSGHPLNQKEWEYFFEEFQQAIYEVAQLEKPFYIKVHHESTIYEINASFSKRDFNIKFHGKSKNIAWKYLRELFIELENIEISDGKSKKPKSNSSWITFNNEHFHTFLSKESCQSLTSFITQAS